MPTPLIKLMAKRFHVSSETAESAWNHCKAGIKPGEGGKGYGLVVKCVKAKLSKKSPK